MGKQLDYRVGFIVCGLWFVVFCLLFVVCGLRFVILGFLVVIAV